MSDDIVITAKLVETSGSFLPKAYRSGRVEMTFTGTPSPPGIPAAGPLVRRVELPWAAACALFTTLTGQAPPEQAPEASYLGHDDDEDDGADLDDDQA